MNHQATENTRKKQKQEIMEKTEELLELICNSEDYIRYQNNYQKLKASADLYERVNEFRRKNIILQLAPDGESYDKMQELYVEYKDILMDPLVTRFMMTEQSFCKLMRKVQDRITDGIDLDISYMN